MSNIGATFSRSEAARALGWSRFAVTAMVESGEIATVTKGKLTVIPASEVARVAGMTVTDLAQWIAAQNEAHHAPDAA